jgi:hypothetical protein
LRRKLARSSIIGAAALLAFGWFGYRTLIPAWSQPSSDFPNYYTAGKLARTRVPLHLYYDWTWFQRQIHFAGIEKQLGGYIPQTPLTLLPFIPLSLVPPAAARKIWLVLNCVFLALSLWLLSRMTSLTIAQLWLISFLAGNALRENFLLGQYYVFLLALLTSGAYCLFTRRDWFAGSLFGSALVLKLYGGPLILMAAMKHRRKALAASLAVFIAAGSFCVAWFGWDETARYSYQILPRCLAGETLNPFHPSNGSASTLLRRMFVSEAGLNPRPFADIPVLFFIFQAAFTLGVLTFISAGSIRHSASLSRKTLAWWIVATLLISPNTASYTFALMILPVALLFDEMPRRHWQFALAAFVLLCFSLRPAWSWLFPRLWLLLFLFVLIGYRELRAIPRKYAIALATFVLAAAVIAGTWETRADGQRPDARFTTLAPEPGAIYSSSPAMSHDGIFYESIGASSYVIRNGSASFEFPGEAFHPTVPDSGAPVFFESVRGPTSQVMRFDPLTGEPRPVPTGLTHPEQPAVSHDGALLALVSEERLYVFDGIASRSVPVPGRASAPSFVPGDGSIVFVSDQQRDYAVVVWNLAGQTTAVLLRSQAPLASPSISPDGRTLLFSALRRLNWQVWAKTLATGEERRLTAGPCNNYSPVWRPGSQQVVFASDCGRGVGLPALMQSP